ncbi:hypothetical protein HYT53_05570 [Candidatus Woesearchaeota archaeon]|nr:hypothetical protein [Candidatus Woesearchaeota archaeon]
MEKNSLKNKRELAFSILWIVIFLSLATFAFAIPNSLTLQGKLTNPSGASQVGTFNFTFRIYDSFTDGSILWQLVDYNITTDANGIYDVILPNINLSFADPYYLGITVGGDNESKPRINLTSAPYSFRSNTSELLDLNSTIGTGDSSFLRINGTLNVTDNIALGDASTDTIAVNGQFTTNLIPQANNIDLGSATNFWRRAYIDLATISNLSVTGNVSLGGTISPTFVLNSNYSGDDARDVELIFERGTPTTNAVLKWDSTSKRFDINFPLFIQSNQNLTVDTNTLFVDGSVDMVGIGTVTPSEKLEVSGDIRLAGNLTSTNFNINETSTAIVLSATSTKRLVFTTDASQWTS